MQDLQLAMFVVLAVVLLLRILERGGHPAHQRGAIALVAVGLATGLLGAVFVLTHTGDLLPDDVEATVSPAFVIAATALLIYLVWEPRTES